MSNQTQHAFLLSPGVWIGQGTIRFSEADDILNFYSRWVVVHGDEAIECTQTVEMEGGGDQVINNLYLSEIGETKFLIALENAMLGEVTGVGVIDEKTLAWEFRDSEHSFEGFEIYELQEEGEYRLKAEYFSADGTRTMIEGSLWKEEEV